LLLEVGCVSLFGFFESESWDDSGSLSFTVFPFEN